MHPETEEKEREKTVVLLQKAQKGDGRARDELYRRLLPRLERFAQGRIPRSLRALTDTQEIVQEAVVRSLPRLETFEVRHEGALLEYLKRILINRIRDLARRGRREREIADEGSIPAPEHVSPVARLVGEETLREFEDGLEALSDDQRMAVSLHVEMGYSLSELAEALDRSQEAARKVLARGLENLASRMKVSRRA